ncbi:DUF3151 domain-containing protein [Ornithinimicrobium pekingense]|uniref:DUF3151 domain-containing protein n=1 Tax=Ornithinimicrobium pekingense TaxID=384677 RepID=A0ABQ2F6F1_9MICO|nr:DUF3151 domain-containing protein [Ornithinimicrobium pekingense]GGK57392.1 hypothetical protein GCM10011509_02220 [Ornithinimicrobium pekingense]
MTAGGDLLGIPPTHLPTDPAAEALGKADARQVATAYPASSLAWATLAERALEEGDDVTAYAFARTGYHRGLDSLRRAGWRGQGPVPWEHEPNRGFLRALAALAHAAGRIGEEDERARCTEFLRASSVEAARELGL